MLKNFTSVSSWTFWFFDELFKCQQFSYYVLTVPIWLHLFETSCFQGAKPCCFQVFWLCSCEFIAVGRMNLTYVRITWFYFVGMVFNCQNYGRTGIRLSIGTLVICNKPNNTKFASSCLESQEHKQSMNCFRESFFWFFFLELAKKLDSVLGFSYQPLFF